MRRSRALAVGVVPFCAAAWLACVVPAHAQITPTKRYLMAFHACEGAACTDPRNHSVYLAESDDGAAWTMVPGWTPFAGSVPDVIQRGRTLYIYTASSFVARYNLNTGESNRVPVRVNGLPSGVFSDWVDPSLHVDDEGRLVLFLMYAPLGEGDPARCRAGVTSCTKQFFSATEVVDSDGTEFTIDDGVRATATISSSTSLLAASDPDIFVDGTQYVLYISHGPSTSVWTSSTLRGSYTQSTALPSGLLSNMRGGVPAGHYDAATSRYWTYAHIGQSGTSVIRRAVHANLTQQLGDNAWTPTITGASIGLGASMSVESPSFAVLTPTAPPEPPGGPPADPYSYGRRLCPALTAPSPLISTVTGHTVLLDWGGVADASSYVLEVGTSSGSSDVVTADIGGPVTSVTVPDVTPGTFYMRVRAAAACGVSEPSNDITAVIR